MKFLRPDCTSGQVGGMTIQIAVNRHPEFLSIRHVGMIIDGKEVTDTPEIKAWAPSYENYTFVDLGHETTELQIGVASEMATMFNEIWPKALAKLKAICERGSDTSIPPPKKPKN